jgi:hypothetical protein
VLTLGLVKCSTTIVLSLSIIILVSFLANNTYNIHIGAPNTDNTSVGLTPMDNNNIVNPPDKLKNNKINVPILFVVSENQFFGVTFLIVS